MSTKDFTANVISATKVVPDGNFKDSKASGIWDINEALDLIKGGNWPNAANINPAAFVNALFQTHLYTGNATNRSITNNIDLSTKEGLLWIKKRSDGDQHTLQDTIRGATKHLRSSGDSSEGTEGTTITAFNSDGFSIGTDALVNTNNATYVSWAFRSQPKFFDVVTYEGTGSARTVAHSLNTTVGMMLIKNRDASDNWAVYHRGNTGAPQTDYLILNTSAATADDSAWWNDTAPTSSVFTVGTDHSVNASGEKYVAYLFAHNNDDGGFGEPGDQDIIKCGSYSGDGNNPGPVINLGFEPQFLMIKRAVGGTGGWFIFDAMRGIITGRNDNTLQAEATSAEGTGDNRIFLTPTGFQLETTSSFFNDDSSTYVYMAIRRGGMQTPTAASDVFDVDVNTQAINSSNAPPRTPFVTDMGIYRDRNTDGASTPIFARLQGIGYLQTNSKDVEGDGKTTWDEMDGWGISASSWESSGNYVFYNWKRARGYFDVVTYTGDGSAGLTVNHNLGVVPEMMWVKCRSHGGNFYDWAVYHKDLGNTKYLFLNTTAAAAANDEYWNDTSPTSSVFSLGGVSTRTNESGKTYIAHLFATVANVSKVGSFTQSGATNVACGFTGDTPSFILLKRTDATGDWLHYDSARGIVAGNDKSLDLNNTDVEVTADVVDPYSGGFATTSSLTDGDYIFYAIASIA